MEKNNLKDMVKSLKAKTSKALNFDEKKIENAETKTTKTTDDMESVNKMIGNIDLKIAEFYKNKQAKIDRLEKDVETHSENIIKKDVVPKDFDSVISGIKIDTDVEEEDDNIGRRVLKEFAIDENADLDSVEDNEIGIKSKNASEELDVLLDIASNGDSEVEEKLLEEKEKNLVSKDISKLSGMLNKLPAKKVSTTKKSVSAENAKASTAKGKKSKTEKATSKSEKNEVKTDIDAQKSTKMAGKTETKKSTKSKTSKKTGVALSKSEISSIVDEILDFEYDKDIDVIEAKEVLEPETKEFEDGGTTDTNALESVEELMNEDVNVQEVASVEENLNDKEDDEILDEHASEEINVEEEGEPLNPPKIDLGADFMKEKADEGKIKVLYVVTECQPFAATGGLADVAGSLPKAIVKEGVDIRVIMPLYNSIKNKYQFEFEYMGNFTVHLSWRQEYCGLFRYVEDGVTYYFIDNERYFKRDNLYGYFDDGERFAYFCKAVVEGLSHLDFFPDIVHCNDWQSALVPVYLKTTDWQDERYNRIKKIYTIHNVEYQGIYGMENLGDLFGIDHAHASDLDYDGNINLTKGAIELSDKVTTVSHSYCENLKQPYCSRGLHHIIYRNENKLSGIINGVDNDFYNPMTDKEIAYNFDKNNKENKIKCKKAWQEELGLPVDPDTPLISMVTRLVSHKGLDLVTRILEDLLKEDIQFVIVGTGDQRFIEYFRYMEGKYPTKVRALVNKFSLEYARKNYAGSDIFLMPSKIEPCGISQMIASRYGSVPIVRETGGLRDTIRDFGCEGGGNGYTFANYNSDDLKYQVKRAISDYHNKDEWQKKVDIVMSGDFGWEKSAKEYVKLYEDVLL